MSQSSSAPAASAIDSGATRSDAGAVCTRMLGAGGTRKHSATVERTASILREANRTRSAGSRANLQNSCKSGRRTGTLTFPQFPCAPPGAQHAVASRFWRFRETADPV